MPLPKIQENGGKKKKKGGRRERQCVCVCEGERASKRAKEMSLQTQKCSTRETSTNEEKHPPCTS